MYGIIYRAISPTGRVYIGKTKHTLSRRRSQHKYRALKCDKREPFQAALLAEGFDNFSWEQIDSADNQADLDEKEKYWIVHFDSMNPEKGYNNTDGGIKTVYSLESRRKNSEAQRGEKNHNFGKRLTLETCRRMSESKKGEKNSRATITEATARQIKIDLQAGMRECDVIKKHNVPRSVVSNIKRGKNWSWLQISDTA